METRRFYTSPVNHHNLEEWDELGTRLEKSVHASCAGVSVDVGTEPVFGYGIDADDALEAASALKFSSRNVHIDLWSSIVLYESVCITFGSGITESEQLAIARRLEGQELAGQVLLRKWQGPYDIDAIQVFGYSFSDGDEQADEESIARLLELFDGPLYIGHRSLLSPGRAPIDARAFDLFSEDEDVVIFTAVDPAAEKLLWKRAREDGGQGLVAMYAGDPADRALASRFSELADLRILLAEEPSAGMRVSLGRCHQDDALVVVYTPAEEPYFDQPLVFAI